MNQIKRQIENKSWNKFENSIYTSIIKQKKNDQPNFRWMRYKYIVQPAL